MTTSAALHTTPLKFVLLVFALSVPFLLISAVTGLQLLPGVPVAGLAFVCPALAAAILIYREQRLAGVAALLKRSFDFKRVNGKVWYFPTLLLMPAVMVLAFIVLRLTGAPVPGPHFEILSAVFLCAGLFVGALGEELGWSGYAIDPMQAGRREGRVWREGGECESADPRSARTAVVTPRCARPSRRADVRDCLPRLAECHETPSSDGPQHAWPVRAGALARLKRPDHRRGLVGSQAALAS